MSQRLEFVQAVLHRKTGVNIGDVCAQFGVSEKTGQKWLRRFETGGPDALADRSHRPLTPAHQVPRPIIEEILALRTAHPTWGARKLRVELARATPRTPWPAPSTITTILKREGCIVPRRRTRRERSAWASRALTAATEPNDVWAADFKGEFRLRAGPYCYPLTVSDLCARFVLHLAGLASTASAPAHEQFRRCFECYGLPRVLRTDNGVPFGAPGALGGLSTLAVWWIRLGIRPERIDRGVPQQNGVHERMHRTLKAETTRPASASFAAQQRRFDAWRRTFNEQRPHEALGHRRPADVYTGSPRPFPRRLPGLEYPAHCDVRRVDSSGAISWRKTPIFLSEVLAGEYVSLDETAEGEWTIAFGPLALGTYSQQLLAFHEHLAWTARKE
jgi:transposase InsO family protein